MKPLPMLALLVVLTSVVASRPAPAPGGAAISGDLEAQFRDVPGSERPWVYWWWLKGNVSEATITRDLEAMKQNGIGGLLMFDARGYHEDHVVPPPSRMEFMSPEWRRMLKFSLAEASRLGLQVSVNLSSCAGALKGPWEVGADAPKRLVWTATRAAGPARLALPVERPALPHYRDLALFAVRTEGAATAPAAPAALSGEWRETAPTGATAAVETVDLTSRVGSDGRLSWEMPTGNWTLLRFGFATMEGHEYDTDVLDAAAVTGHFERMGRAILQDAGPLAGTTLTHFYSVSWEGAAPTWTGAFEKEFETYRGYALRPWLPALAGFDIRSAAESSRLRRDYYRTLGDCFRDRFYGTLQDLCHRAGLKWHSESGGPWDRKLAAFEDADQLAFLARNDMPQGEFWFHGRGMNRPAAMTAHIYGKRLAATEAFTHMVQHWSAYPAALKSDADAAFCDGSNHLIWHTFTSSPPELGLPGSEYFAGTHLNPNVTWWPMARPFLDYLARGQFMLRQGHAVADVACYVGDRPYQHWGRGTNWSERATLRLGRGRTYDLVTTEVLLDRMSVRDGALALPEGPRYRLLVVDLDDPELPPAALRRIIALARDGATVVLGTRRPERSNSLAGYPACDAEVKQMASELWGGADVPPGRRPLGKGVAVTGTAVDDVLRDAGVATDCETRWTYAHRQADGLDVYFLAGSGAADNVFRVAGRVPELWDPVGGGVAEAPRWSTTADGRTLVPLTLASNGSVFVVFRKPGIAPAGPVQTAGTDALDLPAVDVAGPWSVAFEPKRGAPASVAFPQLIAWNLHEDPGIRHFSGRGTYRTAFTLTEAQARRSPRLELGEVDCIARVRLNGRDLGIVWTAPWSVDLAGAAKAGNNELEIEVANLWVNRLIGDAALPPEQRITKTNVTLEKGKRTVKVYQGFGSEDPLLPSGLVGPVRVEFGSVAPEVR